MLSAMNVGIIGSCLSNLPTAFLMQDYGWTRLNNSAAQRSDLFISQIIEGREPPPMEQMQAFFGVAVDADGPNRFLRENYRATVGMTEIDLALPSLWDNLNNAQFDVLLLDNLNDIAQGCLKYRGDEYDPFDIFFHPHLGSREAEVLSLIEGQPPLTAEQSADNWIRIVQMLKDLQPQAKIIFSCAPYCTAIGDPGRYERAIRFPDLFAGRAQNLGVEVLPPANVPLSLTKLPQDRDHFDMTVYRATAGHIFMAVKGGWPRSAADVLVPKRVLEAVVDHSKTPAPLTVIEERVSQRALRPVVAAALGIGEDRVGEDAAMTHTEKWDSLKQISVVLSVEEAFDAKLPFEATSDATSIRALRTFLLAVGVRAADHVDHSDATAGAMPAASPAGSGAALAVSLGERLVVEPVDWERALPGRNLFADFVRRARAVPDAPYMLFERKGERRVVSAGGVLDRAVATAVRLSHLPRGSIVALVLDHSEHLYTGFIGAILAGLTPTILAPRTPRQDAEVFREAMDVLFDRIRPAAVLTAGVAASSVPAGDFELIDMDLLVALSADEVARFCGELAADGFADAVAFLQHSSGTTGHKKGVMLTHGQVLEQVRLYSAAIGLEAGDRIASWLPLYHDMGLITSFILPTVMGCPIISQDAQEWVVRPSMLLDVIESEHANYCWLPNFAFLHMARNDRAGPRDLGSMRMFVNCSEPCRAAAFDAFLDRYAASGVTAKMLQVSYAMAENVFAVTQTLPAFPAARRKISNAEYLSSGRLLPKVEVEIRDAEGSLVGAGELGEICLRSPCLFSGYHQRPDVTAERIVDGWYLTRDLGRLIDGELYIVGRADDLVIVNGKNIVAHEVEDQIGGLEGLAAGRILVAGDFDEEAGTGQLIVLAEAVEGAAVDGAALASAVREVVFASTGVAPSVIRVLPRGYLVKSSSGKLAREASLHKWRAGNIEIAEAIL
jgi:acyl-CoA synthetase (AMP-forming)/AMP-acid ligase II/acyl carrier protein